MATCHKCKYSFDYDNRKNSCLVCKNFPICPRCRGGEIEGIGCVRCCYRCAWCFKWNKPEDVWFIHRMDTNLNDGELYCAHCLKAIILEEE